METGHTNKIDTEDDTVDTEQEDDGLETYNSDRFDDNDVDEQGFLTLLDEIALRSLNGANYLKVFVV